MNKSLLSEIERVRELMSLTEKNSHININKILINENKGFAVLISKLKTFAKVSIDNVINKYGEDAGRAVERLANANTADEQFEALNSLKKVNKDLAFEYRAKFFELLGENEKGTLGQIQGMLEANLDTQSAQKIAGAMDEFILKSFEDLPQGAKETLSDIILDRSPKIKNKLSELDFTIKPPLTQEGALKTFNQMFPSESIDELQNAINDYYKAKGNSPEWLKKSGWLGRQLVDTRNGVQRALSDKDIFGQINMDIGNMSQEELEKLVGRAIKDSNEDSVLKQLAKDKSLLGRLRRIEPPKNMKDVAKWFGWFAIIRYGGPQLLLAGLSLLETFGVDPLILTFGEAESYKEDELERKKGKLVGPLDEDRDKQKVLKALEELYSNAFSSGALKDNYIIEYSDDFVNVISLTDGGTKKFDIIQMNEKLGF